MDLLNGIQLKKIFNLIIPFYQPGGILKSEDQQVTLLASNANIPLEVQLRGFVQASKYADAPMIIQLSYNSNNISGSHEGSIPPFKGIQKNSAMNSAVEGAKRAAEMIEWYVNDYNADLIAISLDHFAVPKFSGKEEYVPRSDFGLNHEKIGDALLFMRETGVFNEEVKPEIITESIKNKYVSYLASPEYQRFKSDFLLTVQAIRPAWAMIDTEKIPPVLDFAITRDIVDAVRNILGDKEVMIEAEFGATGTSGKENEDPYANISAEDFAEKVACFVRYTGANGIAYPVGMKHAAVKGEKYAADVERLEVVQRRLWQEFGYIPFTMHGGTGAAQVPRGLVGKLNIGTEYLAEGVNYFADHVLKNIEAIRNREKKVCGASIYTKMVDAIAASAEQKIRDCGSYKIGSKVRSYMAMEEAQSSASE
ncbi:class II fructose-bisphosphate aldolase [Candidatus Pacearchaeota archaeon]|nr:class II fructose-bisphosphate aldolase [Candidatus Pacearchaeota archaeon]